jgi:hypothetical protein
MIHENQLDTGYFRITPLPGLADISTLKNWYLIVMSWK